MTEARESKLLLAALKRCLKMRGITYKELAVLMHLSESSVKRMFASNSFSLRRFEQVCEIANISIFEVGKMARDEDTVHDPHTLTDEQEQALADDFRLLSGFHLILNGWSFDQIAQAFRWSEPEVIKIFTTLDKLKLITLLPDNKAKLLTAHNIRWRKNGAIREKHESTVLAEFLKDQFAGEDRLLDFEVLELSPASTAIFRRKMENFLKEINALATMDYSLDQKKKESTGILLAMRPWAYSLAVNAMAESYQKERNRY